MFVINNIKLISKLINHMKKNTENNHDATSSMVSLHVQNVMSLAKEVVIITGTQKS